MAGGPDGPLPVTGATDAPAEAGAIASGGSGGSGSLDRPRRRSIAPILALLFVAVVGGAAVFLSGYALGARVATTPGTPVGDEALWEAFWDAHRAITDQFVGEVDQKTLVEGAIDGMVKSLGDRWSQYLTSEQYRESLQGISGRFSGIGAEMQGLPSEGGDPCSPLGPACRLTVMSTVPGAPAEKAGVLAGDAVVAVDGTPLDGMTADDATARIRGPKGVPVTLTIVRGDEPARDLTIVRDYISRPEIQSRTLVDGTVGYVKLIGFSPTSATAFSKAIHDFAAQGITRYVVDLRGNPGGFVSAARDVASEFIATGPIYWQEDARGGRIAVDAKPGGAATGSDVRVTVLIDGNSASASEIVAGALQDTGRATLIGSKSFGKGSIQEWLPLPNDTGGMRLTVLKWLTPDGRWVHDVGLAPDLPVGDEGSGDAAAPGASPGASPAPGASTAPAPSSGPGAGPTGGTGDPVIDRALEVLGAPTP